MDFLFGFIIGYFCKWFFNYLVMISEIKIPDKYNDEDWDWLSTDDIQ